MSDVYYNHSQKIVFITMIAGNDSTGKPTPDGIVRRELCVKPGEGIDLNVIGFKKEKENDINTSNEKRK